MSTSLLPYRLSICGLSELAGFAAQGVSHVVSILDPTHPDPDCFARYGPHSRVVYRFHDIAEAREDLTAPLERDIETILALGERLRGEAVEHLLIHCHAGVSRSTATAAILMAQHNPGREREVFERLTGIRPCSWPNKRMVIMADRLLARDGALIGEMRQHQARVARYYADLFAQHPDFEELSRLPV